MSRMPRRHEDAGHHAPAGSSAPGRSSPHRPSRSLAEVERALGGRRRRPSALACTSAKVSRSACLKRAASTLSRRRAPATNRGARPRRCVKSGDRRERVDRRPASGSPPSTRPRRASASLPSRQPPVEATAAGDDDAAASTPATAGEHAGTAAARARSRRARTISGQRRNAPQQVEDTGGSARRRDRVRRARPAVSDAGRRHLRRRGADLARVDARDAAASGVVGPRRTAASGSAARAAGSMRRSAADVIGRLHEALRRAVSAPWTRR